MSDFKLCDNGHYFPQSLAECPYCPKSSTSAALGKTFQDSSSLSKTQIFGGDLGSNSDKIDDMGKLDLGNFGIQNSGNQGGGNLSRTQIYGGNSAGQDFDFGGFGSANVPAAASFQPIQPSQGRKLVGWLVSFTLNPLGEDFKLYEGRNLIGADPGCDIVVPNDPAVSGRHMTILHRMGHFKFKDEFSTNGTFINEIFVEEGNLQDGDMIRIGDTVFKFRSIA